MNNTITTNILNSYGYKGSEPQYKTINFSIIPKHQNLEDHIEKPQSEFLQQLIDAKKTRELVELHGITLEKTKQFYAEKIQEYNDVIDLKHIKKKRSSSENQTHQKTNELIRFKGDKGKITNFHISINSSNLNPLLNELKKQENQEITINCRSPLTIPKISKHQEQSDYAYKINASTHIKKISKASQQSKRVRSFTERLEQKLSHLDSLIFQNQNDNQQVSFGGINMLKKRQSIQIETKFKRKLSEKKKTNPPQNQNQNQLDHPRIDISQVIVDSFRHHNSSFQQNSDNSVNEEEQPINNNLEMTQINFPVQKDETLKVLDEEIYDEQQIYNDFHFQEQYKQVKMTQQIDFDKRKRQLQRRKAVMNDILNKKKPQFLHICGSRFPVINNDQNWNDYNTLRLRILERQLEQEIDQFKNQKEKEENYTNLKVLEGPPIKIDFKTSDMKQDYHDIKITKILKKIVAVK